MKIKIFAGQQIAFPTGGFSGNAKGPSRDGPFDHAGGGYGYQAAASWISLRTMSRRMFRSLAKRRMPSESFSVAIWSSLSIQRKVFSSSERCGSALKLSGES